MVRIGAKRVENGVQRFMAALREASWTDVASAFGFSPSVGPTFAHADDPRNAALRRSGIHGFCAATRET
jgi:hypothetical protein